MPRESQIRASFLSERLYHFLARTSANNEAIGVAVFKSIVENGLLMTVANQTGEADEFTFGTSNGQVTVHVEQLARVCFTDIPEDKLQSHSDEAGYGRFAVGFDRATIASWAGSPVWYLPNVGAGGLADAAGVLVQYLKFGRDALKLLQVLYQHPSCRPTLNFSDGASLQPIEVINRSDLADGCIARALSFVKEMSPRSAPGREFEYLYEREWRIVDGLKVRGRDVCQRLSPQFRNTLLNAKPEWGQPINLKMKSSSRIIFLSL
jgi:Putative abortive phage resistance protein AbiGi, antitoxin